MTEPGFQTIIFDWDSTLTRLEGIVELAGVRGQAAEVAEMTRRAMEGQLDFAEVYARRLAIIRPTPKDLAELSTRYEQGLVEGARPLMQILHGEKRNVVVISGGLRDSILPVAQNLGISPTRVHAVELDGGTPPRPRPFPPLHLNNGKSLVLEALDLPRPILFVGDGITDLEAQDQVELFCGYGGVVVRPQVVEGSPLFLARENLLHLLPVIFNERELRKIGISKNREKGGNPFQFSPDFSEQFPLVHKRIIRFFDGA